MSVNAIAPNHKRCRLDTSTLPQEPRTVTKIREFFQQSQFPVAKGGEKEVFCGFLPDTSLAGRELAIAVTKGGSPCSDPALLALADYKKRQDATRRTSFYVMPQEYMVDGDCVGVSNWMRGEGTVYAGGDGFDVLCAEPVSRNHPYPHPAHNFMREVLNSLQGLLQMYEDARAIGQYRIVHGDLKPEQYIVDTREKRGIDDSYAALKLTDLPNKLDPKEKTPGFCNPDKFGLAQRFHSDDLYAFKAMFGKIVYRVLTAPLCEGDLESPLNIDDTLLQQLLVFQEEPKAMSHEEIAAYQAKGCPVLTTDAGISQAYPEIFNKMHAQSVIDNLDNLLRVSACNTGVTPVHKLAIDLFYYLKQIDQGLETTLEMEYQAKPAHETQKSVIDTLCAVIDDINMRYFPRSGATASPSKPNPANHRYSREIQSVRTRLFGS